MSESLVPDPDAQPFFEGLALGEIRYQQCSHCHRPQFYPRWLCRFCQSTALEWRQSSGEGSIYSYTVVHRSSDPLWQGRVPYVVALVDLAEGFRVATEIIGVEDVDALKIGQTVRPVFHREPSAEPLLLFTPENPV